MTMVDSTTYYDLNAEEFYNSTVDLDLGEFYTPFLCLLPPTAARILDAGCGFGRDAKHFKSLGHSVVAFDPSEEMVRKASQLLGHPALLLSFQGMHYEQEFDGIWACASLLHVPRIDMPDVITRCRKALKPGGIMYASFKYGAGEVTRNDRMFNCYDEVSVVAECFGEESGFEVRKCWVTTDLRPGRGDERWVNVLALRIEGPRF